MKLAGIAALVLLAACTTTNTPPPTGSAPPATALSPIAAINALPDQLDSYRKTAPIANYEATHPGLGASARYTPISGEQIVATVFIYDKGKVRAPDGATGPEVNEELNSAVMELNTLARMGHLRSVTYDNTIVLNGPSSTPIARCVNFRTVQANGAPTGDSTCVSIQNARFVKVRLTSRSIPEPAAAGLLASMLMSSVRNAQAATN